MEVYDYKILRRGLQTVRGPAIEETFGSTKFDRALNIEPTAMALLPHLDETELHSLRREGKMQELWSKLPKRVRLELMCTAPFGEQWSRHLNQVVHQLTQSGDVVIINPIVTKDSDVLSLSKD